MIAPARVRTAFADALVARWWWAAILWLHGKPAGAVEPAQAALCIAAGFRFYSLLYALLGVLLLAGGISAALLDWFARLDIDAGYWAIMAGLAGAYLLSAAHVASSGADLYPGHRERGAFLLVLFLGMVTVFLALFLGVASSAAREMGLLPGWLNALGVWGLVVFGIGSYVVELVYLLDAVAQPPEPTMAR